MTDSTAAFREPQDATRAQPGGRISLWIAVAIATLIEWALLAVASHGMVGVATAFVAHCIVVAALLLLLRSRSHSDFGGLPEPLAVMLVAIGGAFGGTGALILRPLIARHMEAPELLAAWYDRISLSVETDPLTQSSDHIAIGRSADLGAASPAAFSVLFSEGPIAAQQSALGMIARHFHPDYLPALSTALASPEAVVRVQAAAVAARIKPELDGLVQRRLGDLALNSHDPAKALAAAAELESCAASGLLSETEVARIREIVTNARTQARMTIETSRRSGRWLGLTDAERVVYEAGLVADRRFAELRTLRLTQRSRYFGPYRWRRFAHVARAAADRQRPARTP